MKYEKISTYFKENKFLVAVLCMGGFLFNTLMCFVPIQQGKAINDLTNGVPFSNLCRTVGLLMGLVLIVQFNRFLKRYLGRLFQSKMVRTMRKVSYRNLLKLELSYFQTVSQGDILNKILTDIEDFSNGISKMTMETFDTFVLLIGYITSLFFMDWQLSLITMIFILLSTVSVKWFKNLIFRYTKEYKEYLSETKDTTLACLKNELYYRGLGISGIYRKQYEEEQAALEKKAVRSMVLKSSMEPLYHMIGFLGLFFILWLGGSRVMTGAYPVGTFSAYLTTYLLVARKASRIGRVYGWYQDMRVAKIRCEFFLKDREDSREPFPKEMEGDEKESGQLVLKAEEFSFGFDKAFSTPVLNFAFHSGEQIGICGAVHTGKSTLLAGLTGLYGYQGSLKLQGWEVSGYRCPIGYCPAKSMVFEDTLAENITLGRMGDLEKAIKDSGLKRDVQLFADGEEQLLSHSLVNLSGGQEKRLGIARAVFGEPKLLLLDDPFQSIDKETTFEILDNLKAYKESIVILVTNQPFILKRMNRLLYLTGTEYRLGAFEELSKMPEFQAFIKEGET